MSPLPLFLIVCSEEHEKIQMAAMTASIAAVCERPVHVFVSMGALYAFKNPPGNEGQYRGGRFSRVLKENNAPDALKLFEQGKALGNMKVSVCSMALDILGWEETALTDNLFDGALGLTKYLSDAESGQLVVF